ncbi:hypothetical protein N657DRAFT_679852 [Parathielavia appendiculata]|uniref:Azaphilone pigments biosynthesis cluster protein L N-terminal domain-containing protein n=1 Tax=Parathielavia appendiculata TaxID=2587402 RepID=A0AAN6U330_9PEZI|nr:hypothetical protein N657DRAFT_679852 [Parathielavia appendiculata]
MDPVSITASAITLITAAGAVKTSLQRLAHSLKTADSRITELCNELVNLTAFLEAVERTLNGCRPLDSACVDEDLWHQSELCLVDCQVTLNELAVLVDKVKRKARTRGFGWKVRAAVDLSVYGPDIAMFRDKLHKSNWALQTLLHTVTVSLSLRNNASQDMILFELDRLKSSIDEALLASLRPPQGFSQSLSSDSRVARNLRNLAQAARHFHSAASSTASTVRDRAGSLLGDLPTYRRERVETFIRSAPSHISHAGRETPATAASPASGSVRSPTSPTLANSRPLRVAPSTISQGSVAEDDKKNDEEDDEVEFEELFLDGLEDLAKDSIRRKQFEKAISLLTQAIQRTENASSVKKDIRWLQTQLALCHFFRDDWKHAEPIVSALAASAEPSSYLASMVWTMLHALALAYLSMYAFDNALNMCKNAIQTQRRWARSRQLDRRDVKGCAETTGLLATIFEMQGDFIAAEIYRRQLPEHFIYHHCSNPREFLAGQRNLLRGILGYDLPDFCDNRPVSGLLGFYELSGGSQHDASVPRLTISRRSRTVTGSGDMSPLRASRHQWEKFEMDTGKEVVVSAPEYSADKTEEGDDEGLSTASNSPCSTTDIGRIKRRTTRIFDTRRGRHRESVIGGEEADSGAFPAASPLRQWFAKGNIFAIKPSRTVLRKRPNINRTAPLLLDSDRPKTFRVLRVLHTTGPNLDSSEPSTPSHVLPETNSRTFFNGHSIPELSGETRRACPSLESLAGKQTGNAPSRNGDDVLYVDSFPYHGLEPQPVSHRVAILPDQKTDNFTVRNGAMYVDYFKRRRDGSQPVYRQTPLGAGQSSAAMEAPAGQLKNARALDMPKTSAVVEESSRQAVPAEAGRLMTGSGSQETKEIGTILAGRGRDVLRRAVAHQHEPGTAILSQGGAATLSRVAAILASLPDATKSMDANKLFATRLELAALSARLERWSADSTLSRDLQAVIRSLPCRPAPLNEGHDSGYESMGHECSDDDDGMLLDGNNSVSEPEPRDTKPQEPATCHGEGKSRGRMEELKRRLSWVAGDEASYLARPGSLQAEKDLEVLDASQRKEDSKRG